MEEDDDVPWYCTPCLVSKSAEIFPFGLLSKTELCDLLEVELPFQIESLPSSEIVSKLSNLPNLNSFDIDENLIQTINSKYYKVQELANLNANKQSNNFSLFHADIRSLCKHLDQHHSLLCSTKTPFDIIGITETKQIINKDFLINVIIIDGYQ